MGVLVVASLSLVACGKAKSDGCSKDTDCKNDRVCNDGACVESKPARGTETHAAPPKTDDKSCGALIAKRCGFDPDAPDAAPTASQNACYSAFANEYVNADVKPCELNSANALPPAKSRREQMFAGSLTDTASLTVKSYAFEAYPSWAQANPSKACPDKLEELNEFMNRKDVNDPWGTPYRMACGSSLPPGARGLAVTSAGPDGKDGTDDDVRSWE